MLFKNSFHFFKLIDRTGLAWYELDVFVQIRQQDTN